MMKFNELKKLISLIVALLMLFQIGVCYGEGESAYVTKNLREYEILNALDIFTIYDSNFVGNAELTRAEAAAVASHMMGFDKSVSIEGTQMPFSDVPSNHTFAYEIYHVNNLGIMVGYNGFFNPDDIITEEQFVKVIVEILGYRDEANALGGFPRGYVSSARRHYILDNIDYKGKANLTHDNAVMMVYNALNVEMSRGINLTGGYVLSENKTILESYLGVKVEYGIVSKNNKTEIGKNDGTTDGMVFIGNEAFYAGNSNCGEYLGYNVRYYYKKYDSDAFKTLVYVEPYGNQVTEFNAKDIVEYENNSYTYYVKENYEKTITFPFTADILYNCVSAGAGFSKFEPEIGKVKLIDNDRDNKIDIVSIIDYEVFVIDTVSNFEGYVYSKDLKRVKYKDVVWSVTNESGTSISGEALQSGSVFLLSVSENADVVTGFEITETVSGTVDRTSVLDGETLVEINENKYRVSSYLLPEYNKKVNPGDIVSFYVYGDMLIAIEKQITSQYGSIGYIIKTDDDGDIFDPQMMVQMLAENGEIVTLKLSKKAKLVCFGQPDKQPQELQTFLEYDNNLYDSNGTLTGTEKAYAQPVMYKLNSKGEITELRISPKQNFEDAKGAMTTDEGLQLIAGSNHIYSRWSTKSNAWLNGEVYVDPTGYIISIPKDTEDAERYAIKKISDFSLSVDYIDGRQFPLKFYRTDDSIFGSNLVVGKDLFGASSGGSGKLLVESVAKGVNSKGEICYIIEGINTDGNKVSLKTADLSVLDTVVSGGSAMNINGDFIQCEYNGNGDVDEIKVVFESTSLALNVAEDGENSTSYLESANHYTSAQVYQRKDNVIAYYKAGIIPANVTATQLKTNIRYADLSKMNRVYICTDAGTNGCRISEGTSGDISTYYDAGTNCSSIFIHRRYGNATITVIYK